MFAVHLFAELLFLTWCQLTLQLNSTVCYTNRCESSSIPWCIEKCSPSNTQCNALYYSSGLQSTPLSFGCTFRPDGCDSSSCNVTTSNMGVSSCCCTGDLCNYISSIIPIPYPANTFVCETFFCPNQSYCSHGFTPCLGTCRATYSKNTKGLYSLVSKQCVDTTNSSSPAQCTQGQCVVNATGMDQNASCCCYGDRCNVNVTFAAPNQVAPYVFPSSNCDTVGRVLIQNGNPKCSCPPGYVSGLDQWTCLDINECTDGSAKCTGHCVNTLGSYLCTCQESLGLFLAPDGYTCLASRKCSYYDCQTPASICDYDQPKYCLPELLKSYADSERALVDQHCISVYKADANGTLVPALGGCYVGGDNIGSVCMLKQSLASAKSYICTCTGDMCNHPADVITPSLLFLHATSITRAQSTVLPTLTSSRVSHQDVNTKAVTIGVTVGLGLIIIWSALIIIAVYRGCQPTSKSNKQFLSSSSSTFPEVEPPWEVSIAGQQSGSMWLQTKKEMELDPVAVVPERLEVIGCGQFAKVFKARMKNHVVAMKVFDNSKKGKECYTRETEIYRTPMLKHENVVSFISSGKSDTESWFVMEYYPNGSLYDFLRTHVLDLQSLCDLSVSAASGLAHLHSEIVIGQVVVKPSVAHRDLKSKNVLVKPDGTCAIGDFGLALTFSSDAETDNENQGQVGTNRYMAPEILEGCVNFSMEDCLKIDIYAFSLILWEMASRTDVHGDGSSPVEEYKPPFYTHAPLNPTIEQMKEIVVVRNIRPEIPAAFNEFQTFVSVLQDSWETDVLARLTASCIEARLTAFRNNQVTRPISSQSKDSGLADSRQSPLDTAAHNDHASSTSTADVTRLQPSLFVSDSTTCSRETKPLCSHYFQQERSNDNRSCHLCDSPPSLHKEGEWRGVVAAGSVGAFQTYDNRLANSCSLTETTV